MTVLEVLDTQQSGDGSTMNVIQDNHSNLRVVAAFFLGWVFMGSILFIIRSTVVKSCASKLAKCLRRPRRPRTADFTFDPEAFNRKEKRLSDQYDGVSSIGRRNDQTSLTFTLNLCFVFTGMAQFVSLLVFSNENSWETGCAFTVAWAGMASHTARLVGILIVILELRRQNIARREEWCFLAMFGAAIVFIFVTNAISSGTLIPIGESQFALCARRHSASSLPVSITSSVIHMVLELYLAVRQVSFNLPHQPTARGVLASLQDINIGRACSLFVLDVLTAAPDALLSNPVEQNVPFTVGAIIVLAAFNYKGFSEQGSPIVEVKKAHAYHIDPFPLNARKSRPVNPSSPPQSDASLRPVRHAEMVMRSNTEGSIISTDMGSVGDLDEAVVITATRRSPPLASPALPHSAPARIDGFLEARPENVKRGRILASQTEVAERLAREAWEAEELQASIPTGPVVRRLKNRPQMTILIHHDEVEEPQVTAALRTGGTMIYGSDIIRAASLSRRDTTQTTTLSDYRSSRTFSTRDSVMTAQTKNRASYASTQYMATPSEYAPDDHRFSAISTTRQSRVPARHSFLQSPWQTVKRYSLASMRTKSREELPTVQEGGTPITPIFHTPPRSRIYKAYRRSAKDINQALSPEEPVPPLPLYLSPSTRRVSTVRSPRASVSPQPSMVYPRVIDIQSQSALNPSPSPAMVPLPQTPAIDVFDVQRPSPSVTLPESAASRPGFERHSDDFHLDRHGP